ncbi:hypothetical protein KMW28_27160 [Flammeovirga yaeyamensis]|uniref:Phage protein n=1 Tax=Flammeovirga yaeyamensis TaxID=367791 RepID=A0AAX1NDV9_9BACT|nr:hypothetical protein [Flammeovirga yaeyamensis]MBB3700040.1 hypothetical protein [Flammeovirga yaeyamensis]NMF37523.1 hypothetical protein [Flammeovirga yaeyamensis]QWG04580.1 hypothetical protein KMW28_27160 [Flammeovirga yaeyamensis]
MCKALRDRVKSFFTDKREVTFTVKVQPFKAVVGTILSAIGLGYLIFAPAVLIKFIWSAIWVGILFKVVELMWKRMQLVQSVE